MKNMNIPKFLEYKIHDRLSTIYDSNNKIIVGYVNYEHNEQSWFFFIKDYVSELYPNKENAIEQLCKFYITNKYDNIFNKMGLLNNENFVKK